MTYHVDVSRSHAMTAYPDYIYIYIYILYMNMYKYIYIYIYIYMCTVTIYQRYHDDISSRCVIMMYHNDIPSWCIVMMYLWELPSWHITTIDHQDISSLRYVMLVSHSDKSCWSNDVRSWPSKAISHHILIIISATMPAVQAWLMLPWSSCPCSSWCLESLDPCPLSCCPCSSWSPCPLACLSSSPLVPAGGNVWRQCLY